MRPAGDISRALIQAARDLTRHGPGATMAELAMQACVSRDAARHHIPKLKSRGHLQLVGERRVTYRNRPVAVYAPAPELDLDDVPVVTGPAILSTALQTWTR